MKRINGAHAGLNAELDVYDDGTANVMFSMSPSDAGDLAIAAVSAGGNVGVTISVGKRSFPARAVEARVNTLDERSAKVTGPGVVSFSSLTLK